MNSKTEFWKRSEISESTETETGQMTLGLGHPAKRQLRTH